MQICTDNPLSDNHSDQSPSANVSVRCSFQETEENNILLRIYINHSNSYKKNGMKAYQNITTQTKKCFPSEMFVCDAEKNLHLASNNIKLHAPVVNRSPKMRPTYSFSDDVSSSKLSNYSLYYTTVKENYPTHFVVELISVNISIETAQSASQTVDISPTAIADRVRDAQHITMSIYWTTYVEGQKCLLQKIWLLLIPFVFILILIITGIVLQKEKSCIKCHCGPSPSHEKILVPTLNRESHNYKKSSLASENNRKSSSMTHHRNSVLLPILEHEGSEDDSASNSVDCLLEQHSYDSKGTSDDEDCQSDYSV
ncbi:uncharacterized protein LOC102347824 isoform X2 [Latimeria chalumnae]